ncbi:MAG: response regulator [Anaerolineae bacterium]|nr:response regulator [Anaerolineae bacterium]
MFSWDDITTWTVLVVDDEPDNLEVITETLEFRGAKTCSAKNGEEGLSAYVEFKPAILLIDLSMPNIDGWQMRAKLKTNQHYGGEPMIALTAHAMAGDRERALAAGFDGYLTKPINVATLVEDIRESLKTQAGKEATHDHDH